MEKFLLDANIILGLLNKKDPYHGRCLRFIKDIDRRYRNGEKVQAIIPLHLMIEVNIKVRKKKRNRDWEGVDSFSAYGPEFYSIDGQFLAKVQKEKLYDKFDKLSPVDAIYAMIAYLEKIPLVTLDNDFKKVEDIIEVKLI